MAYAPVVGTDLIVAGLSWHGEALAFEGADIGRADAGFTALIGGRDGVGGWSGRAAADGGARVNGGRAGQQRERSALGHQ